MVAIVLKPSVCPGHPAFLKSVHRSILGALVLMASLLVNVRRLFRVGEAAAKVVVFNHTAEVP